MTAQQWKRAVQPLLPHGDEWQFRGKFAYRQPLDWVVVGVLGEGSGRERNGVYLWAVLMPLYLPTEHLILSWSDRVEPAGLFASDDSKRWAHGISAAVRRLPDSEQEGLVRLKASASEASEGASILLSQQGAGAGIDRLRHVRDATVQALGL